MYLSCTLTDVIRWTCKKFFGVFSKSYYVKSNKMGNKLLNYLFSSWRLQGNCVKRLSFLDFIVLFFTELEKEALEKK